MKEMILATGEKCVSKLGQKVRMCSQNVNFANREVGSV